MDRERRFTNKHSMPTVCGIIPAIRGTGAEPSADCRSGPSTNSGVCAKCEDVPVVGQTEIHA